MQAKEYRTVDKSGWIAGEWHNEPDKVQWQDEATGLPCLIVRGPRGALCGYVGLSESHPYFGNDYNDADVEVHGGLTFASFCASEGDESRHICHVPDEGEAHRVWWLGFDCAHSGDLCPKHAKEHGVFAPSPWESYRTIGYVRNEVRNLARQLAERSRG